MTVDDHSAFTTLIDSDAFIAWLLPDDLLHTQAVTIFDHLRTSKKQIFTTSAVIGETMTVLSHRGGQKLAIQFHTHITNSQLPVVFVSKETHNEALKLFLNQEKKGTSYVDCVNAIIAELLDSEQIFSFDGFYKTIGMSTV